MEKSVAHLLKASAQLECSLEVTARSLLLYHHFRRCVTDFYENDVVAAASLLLSSKLYEQIIDLDSLICVFYSIVNQTTEIMISDDAVYIHLKKTLIDLSGLIFRTSEFGKNHHLAHEYLMPFLVMIFDRNKDIAYFHEQLSNTCIRFLSDFYTQEICLEYSPELISIACIDLSLHVYGFINYLTMVPPWYMGFICNVTSDEVKAIKRIIMNLYDKPTTEVQTQQFLPTLEEQIENTACQSAVAAQNVISGPRQLVIRTELQQCLPSPLQQHLRSPLQQSVQQVLPSSK